MFRCTSSKLWALRFTASKYYSTADSSPTVQSFSAIPSPKGAVPVLGHYFRFRKNFSEAIKQMFEEVDGPILKLKTPGSTFVCINDPAGSKDISEAEGQYPIRPDLKVQWLFKHRNEEPLFSVMFGPEWRERRNKIGKQSAPANVYGYVPGFNKATDRLIRNIEKMQDNQGYVHDMEELVMYWSLEVGAWFSLGADLDSRFNHQSEALQLKRSVTEFTNALSNFVHALPFYKVFKTPMVRRASEAVDRIYKVGGMYADKHMDRIMEGVKKGEKVYGQSLLEQWLIEGKLTKQEAVRNVVTMLASGMDTTACVVAFMLYELSTHKDVQEKLYKQVVSVLGENGQPDMESLQKMPYLMNIIKESQRISSVITKSARIIPNDSVIFGYQIPAGTLIMYDLFTANQSSKIYKEPDRFNPDRWSNDDISPYASVPFGVGPRSCWGRRFAEIEMKVLLSKISQHYIMESDELPGTRMAFAEETLIRPAKPIAIKFVKRK